MSILDVRDLSIRFGGVTALDDVSFGVEEGSVCGLIGPNGAGKTTLFNCVSRLYDPQSGSLTFDGRDLLAERAHQISGLGIARTFQHLGIVQSLTVRQNVMLGGHGQGRAGFLSSALGLPRERREERELGERADRALEQMRLTEVAGDQAAGLPYGVLKRVELARALCSRPRLLMLDEPAGGLSHEEVGELGDLIGSLCDEQDLTILLVEHHMGLVMRVSDHVVVLNFGQVIATGPPDEVQNDDSVVEAYLGAGE
ncbi:MAG TPA: ABC transporter ATP-binding protein [Thermoleophilaceae bacterium]|nr:ABC transporter ATP-binding protein [Thermoleophilaceae bacterium]